MTALTKLQLSWIDKTSELRLEPRLLIEDRGRSYDRSPEVDESNKLIFGDNLLALKALERDYCGRIKCIYIDPPYNTGVALTHYDDGVEHSLWLSLMYHRLVLLRRLLKDDGSIWISIDDNECHYLKIILDEIFGRANFVTSIVWQKNYAPADHSVKISESHEYILVYAKDLKKWQPNRLPRRTSSDEKYKNPDNDPRGPWKPGDYTCSKSNIERPNLYYAITHPTTKVKVWPKKSRVWAYSMQQHQENVRQGLVWWGKTGTNKVPSFKRFLSGVADEGTVPLTVWPWSEVGHTQDGRKEQLLLFPKGPFPTPKPETLIQRILEIASSPGEWVLDSFAGSGTTGAVAHKMGRRWIMVELGEHCHTHIIPRLKSVADGKDQGGITQAVGWTGGGGFRYFSIAPSLLKKDPWGQWIINTAYNAEMLAASICKLEAFTYAPSDAHYWQHGKSTENDFIYVTTQRLTQVQLQALSEEVGEGRSLLVCCSAFRGDANRYPNLTVKKIPKMVLSRCEWGHDDYSLNVENLPRAPKPQTTPQLDSVVADDSGSQA